ncbi:MAG: AAA family ATPase [Tepidisphaerales bacterium]
MSYTIAITGKGGVGKTTVAATLISRLIARGRKPILAVDADPNACLDVALGVRALSTIGRIRQETRELAGKGLASGVTKQQMLELKVAECLVEADDFDLIAMGRPEGPGCYCYANNVLQQAIDLTAKNYPYQVVDNEAGLENLSRRIVQKVDLMVMVADPSQQGLATLLRLHDLVKEMAIRYDALALVINRLRGTDLPPSAGELQRRTNAQQVVGLPDDPAVAAQNEIGGSMFALDPANEFVRRLDGLLRQAAL